MRITTFMPHASAATPGPGELHADSASAGNPVSSPALGGFIDSAKALGRSDAYA